MKGFCFLFLLIFFSMERCIKGRLRIRLGSGRTLRQSFIGSRNGEIMFVPKILMLGKGLSALRFVELNHPPLRSF